MPFPRRLNSRHSRSGSFSSDDGSHSGNSDRLEPPILVYHESARSIVFRDHLRRAARKGDSEERTEQTDVSSLGSEYKETEDFLAPLPHKALVVTTGHDKKEVDQMETLNSIASEVLDPDDTVLPSEAGIPPEQIGGFQPRITPLPSLDFGPNDVFEPLLQSDTNNGSNWTLAETEVVNLFQRQRCCVKTIKNSEWGEFLHRFCYPQPARGRQAREHDDIEPDKDKPFNSFVTSTSLLPEGARKMRCYGSPTQYTVGVVFGLPDEFENGETEDEAAACTQTWAWPAGYSAKTEFNIDGRGRLINGRQEALVPLSVLRQYNEDYLTKDSYIIGTRFVENANLSQIPYNEVYLRIGGTGRLVNGVDCSTGAPNRGSFDRGVGLPVALFVRTASYGNLITLLRTRARMVHVLGEENIKGIPLLMITPDQGVRVLTESLQKALWKIAARNLNPFQNPSIAYKTTVKHTEEASFQQKVDELLDFDESIQETLTAKEQARIAGGFGATDDSVATILRKAMMHDKRWNSEHSESRHQSHKLQDIVNEGLASALRSGDYHTSRQLLILYSLVASRADDLEEKSDSDDSGNEEHKTNRKSPITKRHSSLCDTEWVKKDLEMVKRDNGGSLSTGIPAPPPPPPLDTDRLRSATNSDGLLAVLGAAQVLKAMQDGSAKKRVQEVVDAVEEWCNYGEQSVAFRISSWYDQRAAQGDLKIATENNSSFMAFVSNKAIANRKAFAQKLRDAVSSTNFSDIRFLQAIDDMLKGMHSPCLRLELLQYVLGLDNRYSVAHVARSVELAATCLSLAV